MIEGDLIEFATRLRDEPDGDVVQFGFGPVTQALLDAGLLDRFRLWLHPMLLGTGGHDDLLHRERSTTRWTLDQCRPLDSGIVVIDYRPSTS